jgi:hypothetical protein
MNTIQVQTLFAKQVQNGELQAREPVSDPVMMTLGELKQLLTKLTTLSTPQTSKELKAHVKKLKHKVLVMQVQDIVQEDVYHVWLANPSGLKHVRNETEKPSALGAFNTEPGTPQ